MAGRKHNPQIVGAAGEHFTMYELLRRGLIAALTPKGVPNVDILISNQNGGKLAAIQVKTASSKRPVWPLVKKHENIVEHELFYCFLMPKGDAMADFQSWLVPSEIVALHVKETHKKWLEIPGRDGSPHKDTDRRAFHHHFPHLGRYERGWLDKFEDNWEVLKQ